MCRKIQRNLRSLYWAILDIQKTLMVLSSDVLKNHRMITCIKKYVD